MKFWRSNGTKDAEQKSGLPAEVGRKILLARLAILAERLWLAVWPAAMVAGLFALYVMSGIAAWLPGLLRLPVTLAILGSGLFLLWRGLRTLRPPTRAEAMARIERRSALPDAPLRALADELPPEMARDGRTRALWHAHRERMARAARDLKVGLPHSPVPRRDPFALRNALALALLTALFLGGAERFQRNLPLVLSPAAITTPEEAALDAWLSPPAYTGRAPVVLASAGRIVKKADGDGILAPQGSRLVIRVATDTAPALDLYALLPSGGAGRRLSSTALIRNGEEAGFHIEKKIDRPVIAVIRAGAELARWKISVIPDTPPVAVLRGEPSRTPAGGLVLDWKVEDDHGVSDLKATFRLAETADRSPGERAPLRFDPPDFRIPLKRSNPKKATGTHTQDVAAHPWSGMEVVMRLKATDQAGQTGLSKPVRFRLPGRVFRKPLARALVEQRRDLIRHPGRARDIALTLAALLAWPEGIADDAGTYLGLRHAAFRLHEARTDEQLKDVAALLWELAVEIEDGDLSEAMKQLQAARKALEEALKRGASEEEIARLTQQLREAMNRYLQSMAQQMRNARRDGRTPPPGDMRELSPQDLNRMLDRIEDLARTGSRDAARQMLSELDNLLKSLQPGMQASGPPTPQEQALNELQRMMREQQKLMDETWRARPREGRRDGGEKQRGERREGTPPPGANPRNGDLQDLARRQKQLEGALSDLMKRMENQGAQPPEGLKKSRRAMDGAAGALGGGKRGKALNRQAEALKALREGASRLAEQVARQRGRGRAGRFGRNRSGTDPLGRPLRDYGENAGPDENMVPDEGAVERARRILEALRERANRHDRPRSELDYIDRLLKGLY